VGALAMLLVVLIGNLAGFDQLMRMLGEHGGSDFQSGIPGLEGAMRALAGLKRVLLEGAKLPPYNYWDPSRVIPNTINEFPYWSFLFADLHPHMIGMPFTVLFLSLVYAWLREGEERDSGRVWRTALRWLAFPFCLGALAAINTWGLPPSLSGWRVTGKAHVEQCWLTNHRPQEWLVVTTSVVWRHGRLKSGLPTTSLHNGLVLPVGWSMRWKRFSWVR